MPTIKELQDLKASALEENTKIYELRKTDNRTMTEKEEATVALNNQRMKEYDLELETETRKTSSGHFVGPLIRIASEREDFSLLRSVRAAADHKEMPGITRDLASESKKEFLKAGINAIGDIVLPGETKTEKRADTLAGTAGQGQEIVAEEKKAILPPLVDRLVFADAGAKFMTGLVGTVSIPSYAGTTVAWKTEVEAAADGGAGYSEVLFAPKRLTAYINVSKTFLAQDSVGAERMLLDNIANAVARKLEATVLGPATVAASYPSGIGYKLNAANGGGTAKLTGTNITFAALVGLETSVNASNALIGNLAYITNGVARGILKGIDRGVNNDTGEMLWSDMNTINGYKALATNAIPSTYGSAGSGNMVVFGNWADLCIAQWGGYDITVDPYTMAKTNQVQIVINAYFDAKGLRGSTGATTTLDEYAYSFAALSIS